MLRRRLQDLAYCISYNVNFLHDRVHGAKQFRKQYTMLEELGRGGFGIVYKAERKEDGAPVAVKFIEHKRVREWTMKCKQLIPAEICLLDICREVPGVVQLIDWFANSKGFLIVMERPVQCMDLFDLISVYGYLDEDMARSIFLQIANTVFLLYNTYGIFHRDIKDENIIIDMHTGEATLVDFGAAALISEACVKEFQGTRSYCPPEWFKRFVYMPLEATVWSLGIVLYVMVFGHLPFQNEVQICLGRLIIPRHISRDCENLLRQCLAVTPSRRPNLAEICKHRWLNQPNVIHSEPFNLVLQRNFQKRLEAQRQVEQKKQQKKDAESDGEKVISCNDDNVAVSSKSMKRSISNNLLAAKSPLISSPSSDDDSIQKLNHRHHSSYDNLTMSIRSDMFAMRECYDTDNSVLICSSSSKEDSVESHQPDNSSFYSVPESFSMITTDPQNSESYTTALEDGGECSFKESNEESIMVNTSKEFSPSRDLSMDHGVANLDVKEEMRQANGFHKFINCKVDQAVMNSKLVAKHWPHNVFSMSKYKSSKLQRSLSGQRDLQRQQKQNSVVTSSCNLGIVCIEQRQCISSSTATASF